MKHLVNVLETGLSSKNGRSFALRAKDSKRIMLLRYLNQINQKLNQHAQIQIIITNLNCGDASRCC